MTTDLLNLHQAVNLPIDIAALNSPTGVFHYFARLTDNKQRKLTALQRATQFKGIVKNKGRLVRLIDDTLQIVEDIILLDSNFALLIDEMNLHILLTSSFEFVGNL